MRNFEHGSPYPRQPANQFEKERGHHVQAASPSAAQKVRWFLLVFFAVPISLYAFAYVIVGERMYPPDLAASFLARPWGIVPHALFGGVALLAGAVQFNQRLRSRWLRFHRILGRVYVVSCFFTGAAGMYMAAYSYGGWITHAGFGTLGALLLLTTGVAFVTIRRGDVERHKAWMIRSYALILAAVALRLELPFLGAYLGFLDGYRIVSWLCWIPNLLVAEAMVRGQSRRGAASPARGAVAENTAA